MGAATVGQLGEQREQLLQVHHLGLWLGLALTLTPTLTPTPNLTQTARPPHTGEPGGHARPGGARGAAVRERSLR